MKTSVRFFISVLIPAFIVAGSVTSPTMAQDKAKSQKGKSTVKVLLENDKVRVLETTFKPGDESGNVARPFRVIRALKGGTLQRTYADGKTEKQEWKTGEVRAVGPDPVYTPKNIGKSDVVLYVVIIKEPKK